MLPTLIEERNYNNLATFTLMSAREKKEEKGKKEKKSKIECARTKGKGYKPT